MKCAQTADFTFMTQISLQKHSPLSYGCHD